MAGELGGRRLVAPPGADTRPTPERVREATFNALESLDAIDGAVVVDLFAGSGAMGIEALSRGAARVTFVERDRTARDAITTNLAALGVEGRARVVASDAGAWVRGLAGVAFDLAVCDPPYAFERWSELLASLPATLVVIESGHAVDPGERWAVVREKRYGSTVVTIARRIDLDPDNDPDRGTDEAAP